MVNTTAELLAKERGVALEELLEDLRGNIKTLSKDEKAVLTELLNQKRNAGRKVLSGSLSGSQSINTQVNKVSGVVVQTVKRKTTVPTSLSQSEKDLIKSHKQSIEKNRLATQKLLEQEKKRQQLIRQKPSSKQGVKEKPQQPQTKQTNKSDQTQKPKSKPKPTFTGQHEDVSEDKSKRKLKKKDKTRLAQKIREEQARQHQFVKPLEKVVYEIKVPDIIMVSDLAEQMKVKAAEVLKQMMSMGVMATINDSIDQDTAILVVEEMGHKAVAKSLDTVEDVALSDLDDIKDADKLPRAPVVAVMGHVDHGKTSLLDYIRKADIAKNEVGGITQHIGAYQVSTKRGKITFLDTPGHAAFTQMRLRGANATDIVVLVVAADDGVMPETIDSIKHAQAASTTIIVAINKIDKENTNSEKVRQTLSNYELIDESWGGDTMMIEVSAHTGVGIDDLLEAIVLQAEILELSAVVKARAKGIVLESRVEKGRGKIATLLVQEGTLNKGDIVVVGQEYGRVKQLLNDTGQVVESVTPSTPVEMLGLSAIVQAGDDFVVLTSERKAKEVAYFRQHKNKEGQLQKQQITKTEDFIAQMQANDKQKINILLKADVQGSSQAIVDALNALSDDKLTINIISSGVGSINDTDMVLAATSGAVVLGFGVRADALARKTAERVGVDVRYYGVIYNLIDDVKAMISGLQVPQLSENIIGLAQVKEVFKSKTLGDIAGCIVTEGKVRHNNPVRVLRDNVVIYEGELESLRRFKDEVDEVLSGTECGIGIKDYNQIEVGDQIEVFELA